MTLYREAGRRMCNMAAAGVDGLAAEIRKIFCSKKNWGGAVWKSEEFVERNYKS